MDSKGRPTLADIDTIQVLLIARERQLELAFDPEKPFLDQIIPLMIRGPFKRTPSTYERLCAHYPDLPPKLIYAKLEKMNSQRLLDCGINASGSWPTQKGLEMLAAHPVEINNAACKVMVEKTHISADGKSAFSLIPSYEDPSMLVAFETTKLLADIILKPKTPITLKGDTDEPL